MDNFLEKIKSINTIDDAIDELKTQIKLTPKILDIIDFAINAHDGQFRKSGEPYVVHPILVATIVAHFSKDETVVCSALLHDVVEDTEYNIDFVKEHWGEDVAILVDGLTKIDEIKAKENITGSDSKALSSALSFRKMLIASIDDIRVLVIKLCDRLHNMMSLGVFRRDKQIRIAEETLVVYIPIAHRLGISSIKNALEDYAFMYKYPNEYQKIDKFIQAHQHKIQLSFNKFISNTKVLLEKDGFDANSIKIFGRIKHHYSIYLKMQRKGVSIDEVLDLLAVRILVDTPMDCYKVLGLCHLEYKPLIARFKDYIATPKENGYQTIHTTVFYNSKVYEIQIRTLEMHKIAEFGVAAHWLYKTREENGPSLNWLKSLSMSNDDAQDFYDEAKQDLFSEDIVVYSPNGDTFTMPRGATAFDFAYMVHTDIGNKAIECYINRIKRPLLTELKSSDMVSIVTAEYIIPRCSWIDMVKTTRAKKSIKLLCSSRLKEIDEYSGKNILDTVFFRYTPHITEDYPQKGYNKIPMVVDYFKEVKKKIDKELSKNSSIVSRFNFLNRKVKEYKFDNLLIYSNFSINSVSYDHCCHPKFGDDIVAFKEGNQAVIHHKMCDFAYARIKTRYQMLFCEWIKDNMYQYKMVVSLPNTKGELARLLTYMSQYESYILAIDYGREKHSYVQYCSIEFEINNSSAEEVRRIIEKKTKVIDFFSKKDAYK